MKTSGWVERIAAALVFAALIYFTVIVAVADMQGGLP